MKPISLVIVDDLYSERADTYELFTRQLGKRFDVRKIVVSSPGDLADASLSMLDVGFLLLDLLLTANGWTSKTVGQLDEWVQSLKFPALLVSKDMADASAIARVNSLVRRLPDFQFMSWNELERSSLDEQEGNASFLVTFLLQRVFDIQSVPEVTPSKSVEIIHITDPHFGKCVWDDGTLINLANRVRALNLRSPDFLVASGDIANTGSDSEYALAINFFDRLAEYSLAPSVRRKVDRRRVFLCPGNHDFNRRLSLSANLRLHEGKWTVASIPEAEQEWLQSYGREPYRRFEESFRTSPKSILASGYRVYSRYLHIGLLFVEIDVERNEIEGFQDGIATAAIEARFSSVARELSHLCQGTAACIIFIAHRYELSAWSDLAGFFRSLLQSLNGMRCIVLCGHEHSGELVTPLLGNCLVIRSEPCVRKLGNLSGVPRLQRLVLERYENVVHRVIVHSFTFTASIGWQYDDRNSTSIFEWGAAGVWGRTR